MLPDAYVFLEWSFAGQLLPGHQYLPPDNCYESHLWQPASKMVPSNSRLLIFSATTNRTDLCNQKEIEKMTIVTSKARPLKNIVASTSLFLGSLTLGKASSHVTRIPKQPFGEAHGARNGLLLTALSEPSWKWVLQAKQSLEMTAAQADILTATSWDTLHQNHPARSLLNSWPTNITWDNKCRSSFLVAGCWSKLIHLLSHPAPLSFHSCPPTPERQTPPAPRMDYLLKSNQIPVLLWSEPSDGFMSLRIKPWVFSVADEVLYHLVLATLLS